MIDANVSAPAPPRPHPLSVAPGRSDPGKSGGAVLVFQLAEQRYALPLRDVLELLPMAALAGSPALPAVIAGFLNRDGTAVAVIRFARLLGLPERPPGLYTPLVLLRDPDPPLALIVDRVCGVARLAPSAVVPVRPDDSFNGAVTGTATLDGHVVLVLSAERVLLDKERHILAEFHDRERQRLTALEEALP